MDDLHGITLAVLSLSIDVARWYAHRGNPEALGKLYARLLAHRMVQA